jgi:hypothetical protein
LLTPTSRSKYSFSLGDGRVEIGNNQVENAIRPTAVGKKNWLFSGPAEAGQRRSPARRVGANAPPRAVSEIGAPPGSLRRGHCRNAPVAF